MPIPGHPRIDADPAICGGRPRVLGTRLRVLDVVGQFAAGATEAEILEDYPFITHEDVLACLAYAAEAADHRVVLAAE
jgi:uncharacterized protein (DUF433 family)